MQTWLFVSEHYLWNGMKAHSFWGRNSLQNGGSHTHTDCGSIRSRVCETPSKTRNMDNIRGRHNSHVHNREIPAPVKVKSEMRAKMPAVGISVEGDVVIIIRMESVVMIVNGGCIPGSGSMGNHRAYISIPVPGFIIFEIVEFGIHPSILITKRIILLAYNFTAPVCQGSLTVNTPVCLYSLGGTGISFCHLQLRITT